MNECRITKYFKAIDNLQPLLQAIDLYCYEELDDTDNENFNVINKTNFMDNLNDVLESANSNSDHSPTCGELFLDEASNPQPLFNQSDFEENSDSEYDADDELEDGTKSTDYDNVSSDVENSDIESNYSESLDSIPENNGLVCFSANLSSVNNLNRIYNISSFMPSPMLSESIA